MFPTWRSAGTRPGPRWRELEGTLIFADLSGFTRLSERLARVGRDGAEVVKDIINSVFEPCVAAVLAERGDVVKFAGDGLMCCFHGADHHVRAARAAAAMQRAVRLAGRATTPAGPARVSISIGVETGPVLCLMARARSRRTDADRPDGGRDVRGRECSPARPGTRRRRSRCRPSGALDTTGPNRRPSAAPDREHRRRAGDRDAGRRGAVSMPAGCSLRNCAR